MKFINKQPTERLLMANNTTLSQEKGNPSILSPLLFPPFSGIQCWLRERSAAQDQGSDSHRLLSNTCSEGTILASNQPDSGGKSHVCVPDSSFYKQLLLNIGT